MLNPTSSPDVDDYLIELTMAGLSPNTVALRALQLGCFTRWATDQGTDPRDATRSQIVRYLTRYANAETRSSNRSALRLWYRWMTQTERIDRDPCALIPSVRKPEPEHNVIPDELVSQVLATAGDELASAIILGRFAGLRASEIAAARRGYLRKGLDGPVIRVLGKGNRWRELPAHPDVERVLRSHSGWLFTGRDGLPITGTLMSRRLSKALPDDWTAHSLRHAFASEAYARTRDLRLVQEWLGHASVTTTTRYVQIAQDHEAMSRLRLVDDGDEQAAA